MNFGCMMPRIAPAAPPPAPKSTEYYLRHFSLEAIASVLVTYSFICAPDSEHDFLKQYVGSICTFTIIMTLKDSDYFFPDSTPVATAVLWAATLYTSEDGKTNWMDIAARVGGQLCGYFVVFWLALQETISIETTVAESTTLYVNEYLGTMIEGIAIAFATIPLLSPYPSSSGMQSKSEAIPPSNSSLSLVALSLAAVHYTLERVFRATMNPLVTILRCYVEGKDSTLIVFFQCVGVAVAMMYVSWNIPSRDTLAKLRGARAV